MAQVHLRFLLRIDQISRILTLCFPRKAAYVLLGDYGSRPCDVNLSNLRMSKSKKEKPGARQMDRAPRRSHECKAEVRTYVTKLKIGISSVFTTVTEAPDILELWKISAYY